MAQTYTLRIRNGAQNVRRYRFIMWWKEFNRIQKEYSVYYEKKKCTGREKRRMEHFCARKGLSFTAVPTQYTRSSDYRRRYFAAHRPLRGNRYRCAYCGRKKKKEKITIDHIFPVHAMEQMPAVRRRAALLGIHGVNDLKNLCTACERCNQKKGTQMGWWIMRGFLGRKEWYWKLRFLFLLLIGCAVAWYFLTSAFGLTLGG